jgi:hypothetical protein
MKPTFLHYDLSYFYVWTPALGLTAGVLCLSVIIPATNISVFEALHGSGSAFCKLHITLHLWFTSSQSWGLTVRFEYWRLSIWDGKHVGAFEMIENIGEYFEYSKINAVEE